ncbi:iron uptake transporter permease EfeU [Mycobacterium sp. AZCC_0083]|uniref:iron uptake transporter permease EfeU n=1 Tax=Mycobacterium sp. AZCC_0083 TaxID=2735882 RepID=UPI001607AFD4|nr:iron uptake transporter permease EfeU [Mycobacterium sp. AZCC_0083]MBB5165534.1 high-affinity iron transporter [Mycobacterium sp. AZCC_0083]
MQGIFVGTFLIGLREGLEATLIVSIVGAFLKRNDKPVRPMFIGVGLAVAISIAVGTGLEVVSASLPQRQQEMLETVIGAIAVVFVTTMIIWMNRYAFRMKGELEREAAQAINSGGAFALAVMAFLAVLKEGFETAVFLLAAAQATHGSRWFAVLGGLAGIAVAIALGAGIYLGSLKLDLGRFFRITGVFLVFIAAGLVMSSLRTAHEAGWISIGQQRAFDLSGWMPTKSVLGALITGMFGVPPDPRLIEVLGWLLYAVPVLIVFLWPVRLAPAPVAKRRILVCTAAGLAAAAAALAVFVPAVGADSPGPTRAVTTAGGRAATVTVGTDGPFRTLTVTGPGDEDQHIRLDDAGQQAVDGVDVTVLQAKVSTDPGVTTTPINLGELAHLTGGRLPVGLGSARTPGPFDATWSASTVYTVRVHGDDVVAAEGASTRVATLSGGGLVTPKVVSLGGLDTDWATATSDDDAAAAQITQADNDGRERTLWTVWLPIVLGAAAVAVSCVAVRSGLKTPKTEGKQQHHGEQPKRDEIVVS